MQLGSMNAGQLRVTERCHAAASASAQIRHQRQSQPQQQVHRALWQQQQQQQHSRAGGLVGHNVVCAAAAASHEYAQGPSPDEQQQQQDRGFLQQQQQQQQPPPQQGQQQRRQQHFQQRQPQQQQQQYQHPQQHQHQQMGTHQEQQQQHHHQQQQRRRQQSPVLLLDPQQQHHASVLANAWGESDRRAALSALVKSARDVDSLAAVWLTCRLSAGPAELAVLFNRLGNVCEPRAMSVKGLSTAKVLLRELLIASEDKMSLMGGPEFVYIIAALAKLRASPDVPWINRWLAVSRHRLGRLSGPQLVMCVRALGRLDVKAMDIHTCIAFPAWMHNYTAALSPQLSDLSGFELVKLVLGFSMLGYKPSWGFLNEVAAAVEPKLSGLDTVHLTCLLSSWSILKYEPEAGVMRSVMNEVYTKLPLFDDKDLTTALTAFCSMRKMLRLDVLADFVAQVSTKLSTFSPRELAGVLVALGRLGYQPGQDWITQAAACFRGRLATVKPSTFALVAQGLVLCGHDPEPWLVDELLAASSPRLQKMELADLMLLTECVSKFSYRPAPNSPSHKAWLRWFERVCHVVGSSSLLTKQAMVFLESMCDAGVPPDPQTTDHLVLQMVHNGLSKAPVGRVSKLLEVLRTSQQQAGGRFVNHYANTLRRVITQLSADQVSASLRCLALEGFVPQHWWVVNVLAAAHSRHREFDGPAAAELLWAVAKLCSHIQLPSKKWVQDFTQRFWNAVPKAYNTAAAAGGGGGGEGERGAAAAAGRVYQASPKPKRQLTAQQLGLGLWGAVMVGFKPTEEQWVQWEAAAKALDWGLPLGAVQAAVLGYSAAGRVLPRELSQQLQSEKHKAEAAAHAEVAAAAAAKAAAAQQLAMQQERMRQAAAAVHAFQVQRQQQQQPGAAMASR